MKKIVLIFILLISSIIVYGNTYTIKAINNSGKHTKLKITYPIFKGNSELEKIANKGILEKIKSQIDVNKTFISEYGDKDGYINTFLCTITRCVKK